MLNIKRLRNYIDHPFPLLFVTVSGAHLYGFPSEDSDYDLRGVHLLPLEQLVGLDVGEETIDRSEYKDEIEFDLVTHDAAKFFKLMLKKNGYVLEQLYSPIVVQSSPEHEELKHIGKGCITKYHAQHYIGFARNQWKLFSNEEPPRVKPLLYVYRVLLTGIHLMQTGEVEANLIHLNEKFKLPYIPELINQKISGNEKEKAKIADLAFHEKEFNRLINELDKEQDRSILPESTSARSALDDLLIRLRLNKNS